MNGARLTTVPRFYCPGQSPGVIRDSAKRTDSLLVSLDGPAIDQGLVPDSLAVNDTH